jgi:hypothetical protein
VNNVIPPLGCLSLGIVIGWLVRYFIRRFAKFSPSVMGSTITIVCGGAVARFLDANPMVLWFYPIGMLLGFVIYHLIAKREVRALNVVREERVHMPVAETMTVAPDESVDKEYLDEILEDASKRRERDRKFIFTSQKQRGGGGGTGGSDAAGGGVGRGARAKVFGTGKDNPFYAPDSTNEELRLRTKKRLPSIFSNLVKRGSQAKGPPVP